MIVKYGFTNNADDATSFMMTFGAKAYQNGVEMSKCYFVGDGANYSSDNQSKDIKKGASLDVEVAYTLNDTTTDVEIEVDRLWSLDDKVITKTFKIA